MAIPNNTVAMHHTGTVEDEFEMGMRSEDFSFLQEILNGLYSNVIAAPVREYATNAWDSHVLAGVARPIEVTLPTPENLEFVIQDFGLGMSVDDLSQTYAFYGASDKRDSNVAAGQLGLGSKSALSYSDAFTVTAIKGGVKVVALVTKNERGRGTIKVLDTRGTDEPNGVRIAIPVDRYDISRFAEEAEALFRFWTPGSVLIDGKALPAQDWETSALKVDEHTWLVRKDAGLHTSYVIMGNVPYPVDDVTIGRSTYRYVARLNIGDVDFVPSREAVKHTQWTDETLSDLKDYVSLRFRHALNKAKENVKSRWEDTVLRSLWLGSSTNFIARDDRPIWTFEPNGYGRKTRGHRTYKVSSVTRTNITVITGFTAKSISPVARDRLTEFAPGVQTFLVLPQGVATGMLEGRPNTFAWTDIVANTEKPKGERAKRGPKVETVYVIHGRHGMTAPELAALVDTKVLYLLPGERAYKGDLGAIVVNLYSPTQLPRIQRFVPDIEYYDVELNRQRDAAQKAVTAQDKAITRARNLPSVFQEMNPDEVADTDLADLIRLAKMPDSETMTKANQFGLSIPHSDLPDYLVTYPLANTRNSYYGQSVNDKVLKAERLFYINARYNANKAQAFVSAMTQGAA